MAEIRKPTRKLGPPAQGFTMPPAPKPRPAVTTSPTTKSDLCYAGIGSRETPPNVQKDMQELARILAENGWHLRTGGADGADTAFAQGASRSETPQKGGTTIYLPWAGYNGLSGPETKVLSSSQQTLAQKEISQHHPAWERCRQGARKLHGRNAAIILDADLNSPVKGVICWTPQGAKVGGTATGIRLAESRNIPVYNLARTRPQEIAQQLTDGRAEMKHGNDDDQPASEARRNAPEPPIRPVLPRGEPERERTPYIDRGR